MASPIGDIFGEFMRETLLQTAYLRYEVARLKGLSRDKALSSSVAFMDQNFDFIHSMTEEHGLPWQTLEADLRDKILEITMTDDNPAHIATPKQLG